MKILPNNASPDQFTAAFAKLKRGERLTYFIGETVAVKGGGQIPVASAAMRLHMRGLADLYQRATRPVGTPGRQFEYICQKV